MRSICISVLVVSILVLIASSLCAAPADPAKTAWELSVGPYWTTGDQLDDGAQATLLYRFGKKLQYNAFLMHTDGLDASFGSSPITLDIRGKFDFLGVGAEKDHKRLTLGVGIGPARSQVDAKLKIFGLSASGTERETNFAWKVGAQYRLTKDWSASLGYVDPGIREMRGITAAANYAF